MKSLLIFIINLFLILLANNIKSNEFYACNCYEPYSAVNNYYGQTCFDTKRYIKISLDDNHLLSIPSQTIFNGEKFLIDKGYNKLLIKKNENIYYTFFKGKDDSPGSIEVCFNKKELKFYDCNKEDDFKLCKKASKSDYDLIVNNHKKVNKTKKSLYPEFYDSNIVKYLNCKLSSLYEEGQSKDNQKESFVKINYYDGSIEIEHVPYGILKFGGRLSIFDEQGNLEGTPVSSSCSADAKKEYFKCGRQYYSGLKARIPEYPVYFVKGQLELNRFTGRISYSFSYKYSNEKIINTYAEGRCDLIEKPKI
jgi:hypothetical protein